MIIRDLFIDHFGKFKDTEFRFDKGINIITGENESGKTTIAAFVRGMLYGIPKESVLYRRYLPYDDDGIFGGSMEFTADGETFRLTRSFIDGTVFLRALSEGDEVSEPEALLKTLLGDMTEETYLGTGFLSQDALRDDDLKFRETEEKTAHKKSEEEIRERFMKASASLLEKRASLERTLDFGIAAEVEEAEKEYRANESRIEELSKLIRETEELKNRLAQALEEDRSTAEKTNRMREEKARSDVAALEDELGEVLKKQEETRRVMKFNGLIPLILGLVIGGAAAGYAYSKGFSFSDPLNDVRLLLYMIIGGVICLGLVIFGIVLIVRKRKSDLALADSIIKVESVERKKRDAEDAYRDYMDHREETDARAENEKERQEELDRLEKEIAACTEEKEDREMKTPDLSSALSDLWVRKSAQERKEEELKAMDLALAALEKASGSGEKDMISSGATAYLSRITEGAGEKIRIEPEEMISVTRNGRDIDVGSLSTAAAQEVLLSVRLSRLDEEDPDALVPMVLDDVFANFDTDRLNAGMKMLKGLQRQVILLTCQNRERDAL